MLIPLELDPVLNAHLKYYMFTGKSEERSRWPPRGPSQLASVMFFQLPATTLPHRILLHVARFLKVYSPKPFYTVICRHFYKLAQFFVSLLPLRKVKSFSILNAFYRMLVWQGLLTIPNPVEAEC